MTAKPSSILEPTSRTRPRRGPSWAVPAALILLSLIPVIAGALRMTELAGWGIEGFSRHELDPAATRDEP